MSTTEEYPEFVELIAKQQSSYERIKTLQSNYKKDTVSRKTIDYLNKRIEALQALWDEFRSNHEILKKYESAQKDHDYFRQDIFFITRSIFDETMHSMNQLRSKLITEPGFSGLSKPKKPEIRGTPQFDTTGVHQPIEDYTDKHLSTLLRNQMCNFNALKRAVSKINVDDLKEKWQLEDQVNILRSKWESIDKIRWELSYLLQGNDKDYEAKFDHWEQVYDNLKEELNRKIFETSHYAKTTPRIELPEFNGTFNNWISFRDLFVEMIHNNPTLNKTQKMQFLKAKLKGEAERLIKHLPVSAENYDSCLDIIQHRYDNKRLLFNCYMEALLNQPFIEKPTSANMKKLYDTTKECLNGLENMDIKIPMWGPIIVYLLSSKLDDDTHGDYIKAMKHPRELPDLDEFMEFLELQFTTLETSHNKKTAGKQNNSSNNHHKSYNNNKSMNFKDGEKWTKTFHASLRKCPVCKNEHPLWQCPTFLNMDVATRNVTTKNLNVCRKCLFSHGGNKCNSTKRCRTCNYKHHTLLHDENLKGQQAKHTTSSETERTSNHLNGEQEILLTTLQLRVKNKEGDYVILRALLDQGSQVSLVTENAAQRLNLPRNKMNAAVTGIGTIMGKSKGMIKLECKSIHSDYTFATEALVMSKLINNLPNSTINTENWTHLHNLKLADPDYNISGPIDLLLGADVYSDVILGGIIKHDNGSPVAQHTKLGWILCGATKQFNCLVTLTELDSLTKFWEIEEVPSESENTTEDEMCESFYTKTTTRLSNGRYVVKMPMNANYEQSLGNSKQQATAQFLHLEKKMARQEHFAKLYREFIREYIDLGHMKPVTESENRVQAYLPHHGVVRECSETTKLRAVFNASMKTDSGYSLNDLMKKGPNLQKDILSLIINWRRYKYVLTADIEKMYRQILIHQDQQCLQKIIWRHSNRVPLKDMQLCTLTYGTKVAPFLAMRTLQQLAKDEGNAFPLAEKALLNEFYMDDAITGHHTIESTKLLQKELNELLKKGGFVLRKWATNEPSILKNVPKKEKSNNKEFNFKQQEFSKTLGLAWNDASDTFHFISGSPDNNNNASYTKRRLLSEISKIYDPLGWLAPITLQAKLLFQKLWSDNCQNIGWDQNVPDSIEKEWRDIRSDLPNIKFISLPRWIKNENNGPIELQAFCDASEKAYACVIYSRTTSSSGAFETTLLAAKTKVAPIKKKTSIPRLELCAAVLLARLIQRITKILEDYELRIKCWTDSQVVLAWLHGCQTKYEKYVTNRTTQILNIVPAINWGYVKTTENPADCATRGLSPTKLINFSLWWEGPKWLKKQEKQGIISPETYSTNEGILINCFTTNNTEPTSSKNELINSLLERHSNIDRITRILTLVIRFADALRKKRRSTECNEPDLHDLNKTLLVIIKSVQQDYFENEINSLKKGGKLTNKSTILKLNPFLDANDVLRVGGRLNQANLPVETKHPILLPGEGRLTQLIIEKAHQRTLHSGARLTLADTRNNYWIISGNRTVKKILRQCIRCRRYATTRNEQLMGNLPKERITPSRPFSHTGVDFTGHVDVKINKGRGIKTCKGYIAIFICMCTKAVHIELVSDLSTQTFIAALKRMCARRGTPKHIYSDNGTNFVGAARVLKEEFQVFKTLQSPEFFKEINDLQIEWHFNAPSWPSAGGLWEAAVRSMKAHLKRVIGQQKLTYEQFATLLTQIEACMNSRPLCPLTEDIEDLDYLTPGHFLTGGPTLTLPLKEPEESKSKDIKNNWKLIERMRQHYWNRWSKEYLHSLQNRNKWQQTKENIQKGQLVLVKESSLPPSRWAMGRVVKLHPGSDNLVRVVTIKTHNGMLKRPITKLAPLPINEACGSAEPQEVSPETDHDEPKSTANSNKSTSKIKKGVNSLLLMLLVAFTTLSCGLAAPLQHFKITPLAENQPVYFDPVGNIQLIHDEWKLLVYFNLTTFWQSTTKVEKFVNHLGQICNTMPNEPCHSTLQQLKFEMNQLNEYNTLLRSQHQQRRRRGYVNGVGNLARALFGVLDSDFAEKYAQDIEKIKTNEQYLLQLIRNQTLIIEAENSVIKKNEDFVKKQLEVIQQFMNDTRDNTALIENRFQVMKTMNDVNAGALTASLLISVLRRSQEMLLSALTDIYRGHLDVTLFTPEQLSEQLNYIAGIIPKRLTLPIKNSNEANITDIYKIIYVKARLTELYLLFELHIPLLSDDEYSLFRNIAIPSQVTAKQCQVIDSETQYIGVNFAKNTYIQMEETDIQQCTSMPAHNHICHAFSTIRNLHGETASCEAKILSQNANNITCDWKSQQCANQWIKLQRPNIWLYNCVNDCTIRIVCENRITTTIITKAGLLALGQDCILQHKDDTIYSHNVFSSSTNIGITLEVPTIDSPNDMWNTYKNTRIVLPKLELSKEHNLLDGQIKAQKGRETLPNELSVHDIGNYTISALLVGGIVAAITIWRLRICIQTHKSNTAAKENKTEDIELQEIPAYATIQRGHAEAHRPSRSAVGTTFKL